jgi:hypothetical protein
MSDTDTNVTPSRPVRAKDPTAALRSKIGSAGASGGALMWLRSTTEYKGTIRTFSRGLWDTTSIPSFVRGSLPKRCWRSEYSAAST